MADDYSIPPCTECENGSDAVYFDEDNMEWVCDYCDSIVDEDPPQDYGISEQEFDDILGLSS